MAWRIFLHAVKMVFNNPRDALKIALVPCLVMIGISYGIEYIAYDPAAGALGQASIDSATLSFLTLPAFLITAAWLAVGWHRYVLLEEDPSGYFPKWHGPQIIKYMIRVLLISLILVVVGLVVALILGLAMSLFMGSMGAAIGLLMVILVPALYYIFFRIALCLPEIALGKQMKVLDSWQNTKAYSKIIWGLVAISILVYIIFGTVMAVIITTASPAFQFWVMVILELPLNIIFSIVGASLLTTLYGVIIEGREVE